MKWAWEREHDVSESQHPEFPQAGERGSFMMMQCILALVGALLAGPLARAQPFDTSLRSFPLEGSPGTSFRPTDHVLADFDGDGDLDVAQSYARGFFDSISPRFGVVFNHGDGTFSAPTFKLTPSGFTAAIAGADLDGDGDIDVALAQSEPMGGEHVLVFLNSGTGAFGAQRRRLVGVRPVDVVAADFDADGDIDLAASCADDRVISVLLNDGAARFSRSDVVLVERPNRIEAGDFDSDGAAELLVEVQTGSPVAILLANDGSGSFTQTATYAPRRFVNRGGDVAAGDIDNDGDLDVVVGYGWDGNFDERFITVARNDGAGGFAASEMIPTGAPFTMTDVRVSDATGDGVADIIAAGTTTVAPEGWVLLAGDGAGGFQPGSIVFTGQAANRVSSGDVSGDGWPDVIVNNSGAKSLTVHVGGPQGFKTPTKHRVSEFTDRLAIGDVDLDGDLDVVSAYSSHIYTLFNDGDGVFNVTQEPASLACIEPIRLADLDGDGFLDLLMLRERNCPPYDLHTFTNDGDGTFSRHTVWSLGSAGDNEMTTLDFDNDGDIDVAITESLGCASCPRVLVFLLENRGDGTFELPIRLVDNFHSMRRIEAADIDQDGNMDLVGSAASDGIGVLFGDGAGNFAPIATFPLTAGDIAASSWVAIDDMNNDGLPDVAYAGARNNSAGDADIVGVMLNQGAGQFVDAGWRLAAATVDNVLVQYGLDTLDADLDGNRDIIMGSIDSDDMFLFLGNGDGTVRRPLRFGLNGNVWLPQAADIDGDGDEDVVAAVMDGPPVAKSSVVVVRNTTRGGAPGDLDGDGDVDLTDLAVMLSAFGRCTGDPAYNPAADIDGDGCVGLADLATLLANFGS